MVISRIVSILRILIDLYAITQKIGMQNNFADIVCSVLVVKKFCWSTRTFKW